MTPSIAKQLPHTPDTPDDILLAGQKNASSTDETGLSGPNVETGNTPTLE